MKSRKTASRNSKTPANKTKKLPVKPHAVIKPAAKPAKTGKAAARKTPARLLQAGEPAPYRIENAKGSAPVLIVCDHASNRVPQILDNVGLSKADLQKHIAWDPGTENIGQYMSEKLDAAAFFANYSRIVVDVNRGERSPECMRDVSDHIQVPGNKNLSAAQKRQRLDEIFWPYHHALSAQIKTYLKKGIVPMIVSLHSFTPEMDGYKRPWEIGVLWNKEETIARSLIDNLRAQNPGMVVGENEPYTLKQANLSKNTIKTHAEDTGLPYVIVEFRQDLVATKRDALKWGRLFIEALAPILLDEGVYRPRRERERTQPVSKKPAAKKTAKTTAKKAVKKPVKKAAVKPAAKAAKKPLRRAGK
ncbi:MAG: N-formylglutamate amidohydrolase [Bdellovibrionales bacterium]|jgi:predicted N-formylglutamate amidohydrolase|nr:N-formylglutamate amidohydrolase [Bdellovibrionales bacterium]